MENKIRTLHGKSCYALWQGRRRDGILSVSPNVNELGSAYSIDWVAFCSDWSIFDGARVSETFNKRFSWIVAPVNAETKPCDIHLSGSTIFLCGNAMGVENDIALGDYLNNYPITLYDIIKTQVKDK